LAASLAEAKRAPPPPPPPSEEFAPAAENADDVEDLEGAVGLTTAAKLYRKRDFRGALAELAVFVGTSPNSPHLARARFVMAHCLRELRRFEDAAAIYADLVRVYPLMADDSLFELGVTRAAVGDHAGAAEALGRVSRDNPRYPEAQRLLAWSLYRAGAHDRLVELLGRPDDEGPARTPEQRYVLGLSRLALGDGKGALDDLRAALVGGALTPLAAKALDKLVGVQVDGKPAYKDHERKAAAAALPRLSGADPQHMPRAYAELEAKLTVPGGLLGEVRFAHGEALMALGQLTAAEGMLLEAARALPNDEALRSRARLRAADAARMQNRFAKALEHYRAASQSSLAADAEAGLFGVSDTASRLTRYDEARQALQELLVRNPLTRSRPRALWSLGWIEYRAGNMAGARQFFRSLVEEGVRGSVGSGEPRALYWTGRTSERLGERSEAQRAYARVVHEYPVSYYASLAERRLVGMERASDPWPQLLSRPAGTSVACPGPAPGRGALPGASDPVLLRVKELLRLGLTEEARVALDAFNTRVVPRTDDDQLGDESLPRAADVEEAVALNQMLGRYKETFQLRQLQVEGFLPAESMDVLTDHLHRSHPRKYAWLIESYAQKQGLSPLLVYALTRTESRFRNDVVSPADAHGLMQLLPETAALVAADLGMAVPGRTGLHNPETNVRLGTAYLRRLMRRFEGEPTYALAAYNAGQAAVERWQRERGTGQVDEFVEEIPFDETRLYVKKVLASHRIYERLHGDVLSPDGRPRGTHEGAAD
jgi:soluble lytic murein transglycosylase